MNDAHRSEVEPIGYVPVPEGYVSHSRLERVLRSGRFAVTAELNPPDSADPEDVFQAAQPLGALDRIALGQGITALDHGAHQDRPAHTAPKDATGQMLFTTANKLGRQNLNAEQNAHAEPKHDADRQPGVQNESQLMLLAFHLAEHDCIRQSHEHPRQA